MDEAFECVVQTPERQFYAGQVMMLELTTSEGEIGIYKGHIPLTARIAPGVLKIHEGKKVRRAALISGFLTVLPGRAVIMADEAQWPEEIDLRRAQEAEDRARQRLAETGGEVDTVRAEMALKRAMARLGAANQEE